MKKLCRHKLEMSEVEGSGRVGGVKGKEVCHYFVVDEALELQG